MSKKQLKNANLDLEEISESSIFNNKYYSGKDEKYGIIYNNLDYILKVPVGDYGVHKLCAEYIASHIYKEIGVPAQESEFIKFNGDICLIIKDFLNKGERYIPLGSIIEEQYDIISGDTTYSYENFCRIVMKDKRIADKDNVIHKFWIIFIVDFLIANRGRNASNLGFIIKDNKFYFAPVFDNASSFLVQIHDIDNDNLEVPKAKISFDGQSISNYNIIKQNKYEGCRKAVLYILQKFDLKSIEHALNKISSIDDEIGKRFRFILKKRLDVLTELSKEII